VEDSSSSRRRKKECDQRTKGGIVVALKSPRGKQVTDFPSLIPARSQREKEKKGEK